MAAIARLSWRRLGFLVLVAIGTTLALAFATVLDTQLLQTPFHPSRHPFEVLGVGFIAAYALARRASQRYTAGPDGRRDFPARLARRFADGSDAVAGWLLGGRALAVLIGLVGVVFLLGWLPAYLTWPLWTDQDHFATLALSWDRGKPPWRDMLTYQFPGEIYLFWLVGRLGGWGRPRGFLAVDAGLLVVLVAATLAWGRRKPAAALIAVVSLLFAYVDLPFTHVAQRDWHAATFGALGLLVLGTWPGRGGRVASALAAAIGLAVRPHVVVLLPAYLAALDAQARPPGERWGLTARAVAEWAAAATAATVLLFAPIVLSGLTGDFLASLRAVARSGYGAEVTARSVLDALREQVDSLRLLAVLATCAGLAVWGGTAETRRTALVWTLAVVGILFYRPFHPIQHLYLNQPFILVVALASAVPIAWVLSLDRVAAPVRLAIVAMAVAEAVPYWPEYSVPIESVRAVGPLARGEEPAEPPLGSRHAYPRPDSRMYHYSWADYRALLDELRRATGPTTQVANLLTHFPYPAVNATVGRPTPLPIESITFLQWFPDSNFDEVLSAHLERAPAGTVVLWDTSESTELWSQLVHTRAVVQRDYPIATTIGEIQVRRRQAPPRPASGPPPRIRLLRKPKRR